MRITNDGNGNLNTIIPSRENVEYFKYFGSMITDDAKYTREIKCRVAITKATFNEKKTLFSCKLDLN
jgi:hypothetical protein